MAENNTRTSKLANAGKKISKFFRDIRSELKKVIWPNRSQLTTSTISVLVICFLLGSIIWVADAIFAKILEWTLMR
jgi:preprotein translocase subunit SecE